MKNYLKKFKGAASLLLTILVVFGLSPVQNVFAQARADEVPISLIGIDAATSNLDKIFVLQGESVHFKVQSDADEVTYHIPTPDHELTITMVETSPGIFEKDWTPQTSDRYDTVVDLGRYDRFREITFSAYSSGVPSGSCTLKYAVLLGDTRDFYIGKFKGGESFFDWTSPTDNRFLYGNSGEYNCWGFVLGDYDDWLPTPTNGGQKIESDDPRWADYPSQIWYQAPYSSGQMVHVVKVIAWFDEGENKGKPKTIQSKETAHEVIEIPAYITGANGKPDFDIYNNLQPVSLTLNHTPGLCTSISLSEHSSTCTVCGEAFTAPHVLVQNKNSYGHYQTCKSICGYQSQIIEHSGPWVYLDDTQHKRVCDFAPCGYVSYADHDAVPWTDYGDSAKHRKYCATCSHFVYEDHTWGPWDDTDVTGGHYRTCTECGYRSDIVPHVLIQHQNSFGHYQTCDCGYQSQTIEHYGPWEYINNNQHKRVCDFAPCGYVSYDDHDTAPWTDYGDSAQHRKYCSTCSHFVYQDHTWGPWDDTGVTGGHYRTCTVCGYRSDTVPHVLTTLSNSTSHYQRCDLCGYVTTPLSHTGPWEYLNTDQHKRICTFSGCGYPSYDYHNYGAWTDYGNSTQHRKYCICGDYNYEDHSWGPWDNTGVTGGHYRTCTVCGYRSDTVPHVLTTLSNSTSHYQRCDLCGYVTTPLPHTGPWEYYSTAQHKRICTFTGCGYPSYADHAYGSWTDYGNSSQHRKYCSACGDYEYANHSWGPWDYTGSSGHYRTCTVCGYRSDTTSHSLRTISNSSTHYQTCDTCGYTTTPLSHTYGSWAYYSSTQHYRTCTFSGCGYPVYASHGYGSWTNYGSSSQHRKYCSTCGDYEYASHSWGPWDYTGSSGHYRTCTVCGYRSDTVSHSLYTISSSSTHYQRCDACGYTTTPLSHTYGSWAYYSSSQHKRTCTFSGCGYPSYGSHGGTWANYSSTQHRKYCSTCGSYIYGSHSWGSWTNYGNSTQHRRYCSTCGGYSYEGHSWKYSGSSKYCTVCGYN